MNFCCYLLVPNRVKLYVDVRTHSTLSVHTDRFAYVIHFLDFECRDVMRFMPADGFGQRQSANQVKGVTVTIESIGFVVYFPTVGEQTLSKRFGKTVSFFKIGSINL